MGVVGARPKRAADGTVDWLDFAVCRNEDPELFFPFNNYGVQAEQAKRACGPCKVKAECLLAGEAMGDDDSVRGGLIPPERRYARKQGWPVELWPRMIARLRETEPLS